MAFDLMNLYKTVMHIGGNKIIAENLDIAAKPQKIVNIRVFLIVGCLFHSIILQIDIVHRSRHNKSLFNIPENNSIDGWNAINIREMKIAKNPKFNDFNILYEKKIINIE